MSDFSWIGRLRNAQYFCLYNIVKRYTSFSSFCVIAKQIISMEVMNSKNFGKYVVKETQM